MKALFCSDLHLKGEKPIARLDTDWLETQRQMLGFIVTQANNRNVDLYLVGDIFDTPRVATEVLNMAIEELQYCENKVYVLVGNHEAPGHDPIEALKSGSVGVLCKVFNDVRDSVDVTAHHFGNDGKGLGTDGGRIRLTHQLVFEKPEDLPPNGKGKYADQLLDEFQEDGWIICGDMHQAFHHIRKSTGGTRHVVNLGCTIRHKASELDYTPSCWYIDTDTELAERIAIPDDPAMVSRNHLEHIEEKDGRISAFLEVVKGSGAVTLSFMDNLEAKSHIIEEQSVAIELADLIQICKMESK